MGMTNRQLAHLAIKLVGLYCLIRLIEFLPLFMAYGRMEPQGVVDFGMRVPIALTGVALAVLAVALIWKSEWLVRLVVPPGNEAADPLPLTQGVLFSVVGIVLIAQALPALGALVAQWRAGEEQTLARPGRLTPLAWSIGIRLALGVALFLAGGALARFWHLVNEMNRAP